MREIDAYRAPTRVRASEVLSLRCFASMSAARIAVNRSRVRVSISQTMFARFRLFYSAVNFDAVALVPSAMLCPRLMRQIDRAPFVFPCR